MKCTSSCIFASLLTPPILAISELGLVIDLEIRYSPAKKPSVCPGTGNTETADGKTLSQS
jgi:hypothetical protein